MDLSNSKWKEEGCSSLFPHGVAIFIVTCRFRELTRYLLGVSQCARMKGKQRESKNGSLGTDESSATSRPKARARDSWYLCKLIHHGDEYAVMLFYNIACTWAIFFRQIASGNSIGYYESVKWGRVGMNRSSNL